MSEPVIALTSSREHSAPTASGYAMLLVLLAAVIVQIFGIIQLANDHSSALAIATVMSATGSFDHRAIDGADGAMLMKVFKELVEKPLGLVA